MANFSVPRKSTSAILLTLTVVHRPRSLRCTLKLLSASHTRKIVLGILQCLRDFHSQRQAHVYYSVAYSTVVRGTGLTASGQVIRGPCATAG